MTADAWDAKIETDERGFELHLRIDEEPGLLVINVQAVAEDLWDQMVTTVGPWVLEKAAAKRDYEQSGHRYCPDEDGRCFRGMDEDCPRVDNGPWPGEDPMDYYKRTGDSGPLLALADDLRDRAKEGA